MLTLYRVLWWVLLPVVIIFTISRMLRGKEDPKRWLERFGGGKKPASHNGETIWFHGASVGELLSIQPLLIELLNKHENLRVIVTSQTRTSAQLMAKWIEKQKLEQRIYHRMAPFDWMLSATRFLNRWQPDSCVFIESEFWPELLTRAPNPYLINARLSVRSQPWRRRFAALYTPILQRLEHAFAQTDRDALHLRELGTQNVSIAGNIKFDAATLPIEEKQLKTLKAELKNRTILVCASTHPGEEVQFSQLHQLLQNAAPDLLTIIVPRHPERGSAIGKEIHHKLNLQPHTVQRRSAGQNVNPRTALYIADTLGEMGLWMSLADVVVMGGTLVPHGGHNPLEPLKLHVPTFSGPHMHNFPDMLHLLTPDGLLRVAKNREELTGWLLEILTHPQQRQQQRDRIKRAMPRFAGATKRIAVELNKKLNSLEQPNHE